MVRIPNGKARSFVTCICDNKGVSQTGEREEATLTNLQAIRLERGQTQRELADELGVSFQSLSRWENGTHPHPGNGKKLRDGLSLPLYLLLATQNKETSDLIGQRFLSTRGSHQATREDSLEQE